MELGDSKMMNKVMNKAQFYRCLHISSHCQGKWQRPLAPALATVALWRHNARCAGRAASAQVAPVTEVEEDSLEANLLYSKAMNSLYHEIFAILLANKFRLKSIPIEELALYILYIPVPKH